MPKSKLAEGIAEATMPPEAQAAVITEAMKPRRKRTTRKVKQVFSAEHAVPPAGFRWVYNRLTVPYESMFDGMVYAFEPNEYRLLKDDTAYFLWANAIIQYSPVTGVGLRALAMDANHQMEKAESEGYGVPLEPPQNPELVDRTGISQVRVKGGEIARPVLVAVMDRPAGTSLPR